MHIYRWKKNKRPWSLGDKPKRPPQESLASTNFLFVVDRTSRKPFLFFFYVFQWKILFLKPEKFLVTHLFILPSNLPSKRTTVLWTRRSKREKKGEEKYLVSCKSWPSQNLDSQTTGRCEEERCNSELAVKRYSRSFIELRWWWNRSDCVPILMQQH